ncbi:MAG: hypothetical protein HYY54_08055 [candidate division NC10 bacterium]|nr:hypothetical protein [candidate division NC10 bacterium]
MAEKWPRIDLTKLKTYPLRSRPSKVQAADLGGAWTPGGTLTEFLKRLPRILAGSDLRAVVGAILAARRKGKPVIAGLGGHVIKVGCSPLLVDLMERGLVTALAMNGSCAIHDFELAYAGCTSEDVEAGLAGGAFGMAAETGEIVNRAVSEGIAKGWGFGRALGETIRTLRPPHEALSLFAAAVRLGLPATVHVAIGTDIVHMHPACDGAAVGGATLRDFHRLTAVVATMGGGGVYLNLGSAVLLPEVFVKAVTVARNAGHPVTDFTTVNCDFLQHYRPTQNVVRRPVAGGAGKGYALTGHHELLLPLLCAALVEGWEG